MAVEEFKGGTVYTGDDIHKYRICVLRTAMKLQLAGMSVKRYSVIASVKKEFGLTGTNQSVYEQFCRMHQLEP